MNASNGRKKRKIIMLVIDTLMDSTLRAAMKSGKAPAFKYFIENGRYFPNLVSPFPTMSVNVDSSLLTGVGCDEHKIPGLVWYNEKERRIVNYGSHARELVKLGLKQSMEDIFYNLNNEHLSKHQKTIHEILHEKGVQTASINALLYRGSNESELKIPFLLSLFTGFKRKVKSQSPDIFSYGKMHRLRPLKKHSFFWQRYGVNDKFTTNELIHLISQKKLPAFTIAYFPDLDRRIHKNGRNYAKGIQMVDKRLQEILNQYPSWEDALANNIWIILGDNGQAWIHNNRKDALIDLRKLLKSYKIVKLSKGVAAGDEIVLAANERMAYIYTLDTQKASLDDLARLLRQDQRIDVIALKKEKGITVISGLYSGQLQFRQGGDFVDDYGQSWHVEGNKEILDIEIADKKITYGQYPDALGRLLSALRSHDGNYLIASAKPGYEFIGEDSPTHVGGASHGGLHKQDSFVSLIVAGTQSTPERLRIIDVKDWLLSLIETL